MNTNEPTTPSDAPPPDEHKCGYLCNHCKQHFPGYAQYWEHKCKTVTLPESSDAPTPETLPACACDEMWPGKGHHPQCPVLRVFDELARERDEARAELAKVSDPVAVHINMLRGTIAAPSRELMEKVWGTPPPTEGSAVEWVHQHFCGQEGLSPLVLMHDDAIELARRCEKEETNNKRNARMLAETLLERDKARSQLAAAQAEARELREAIHKLERMADERSHQVAPTQLVKMFEEIEDAARAALAKKEGH